MINNLTKPAIMKKTIVLIGILMSLALCACDSKNEPALPSNQLTLVDWQKVDGRILLNDEILPYATAEFLEIPDSEKLTLKLHGVHPTEDIEMQVETTTDDDGDIQFKGTQTIDFIRSFYVKGLYKSSQSDMATTGKPSFEISINYSVPYFPNQNYQGIKFDDNNGFRYVRELGVYPMSKVDIEAQRDSCDFICKSINSELQKKLKSLTFNFDLKGKLTLSYIDSELEEFSQTFRYWRRYEGISGKIITEVENANLFYETILTALGFHITADIAANLNDFLSTLPDNICSLLLDGDQVKFTGMVVFLDAIHYHIFQYFKSQFMGSGIWGKAENDYINLMYSSARGSFWDSPDMMVGLRSYRWAFEIDYN